MSRLPLKTLYKEKQHYNSIKESLELAAYKFFPVVCPTCHGTGYIEKDAPHLVTFVPVKDERLHPAWTKAKIIALIVIILVIVGSATYFLYPRPVTVEVTPYGINGYDFDTPSPWIEYSFTVAVFNRNFFPVTLKHFTLQMQYIRVIVSTFTFQEDIDIGMRTVEESIVKMNASYNANTDLAKYIRWQCYTNRNFVPQCMVSSSDVSYWMHTEHMKNKDNYFFTDCDTDMMFSLPGSSSAEDSMSEPGSPTI